MKVDLAALGVPTVAEIEAERRGKPLLKGPSRLEQKTEDRKLVMVTDGQFRKIVLERDHYRCRWCLCAVVRTTELVGNRAEVHHVHGRRGILRHEDRCALLLCLSCHEKVTGRVNERWIIVATVTLEIDGRTLTDAREKVTFERVA